ncbi:guanylate kinase-associated protein mars [Eurosta solidaginis]|uniref:guanylate kinase-associated protein mars n=1 Tax=Eurosta solidaginis TaxID=178769 RepID=UPI0035317272
MDRYRNLYKENASILNQAQHNRRNRELQNANRAKSRRQIFESGRNIEVSHTPRKVAMPQDVEVKNQILEKENIGVVCNVKNEKSEEPKPHENDWNKSRIALAKKVNPKIATKQETFLLKFIKWKEAHKLKEKNKIEPKRRPFAGGGVGGNAFDNTRTPAVSSNVNNKVASFVPKGHTTFKAPPGLRSPTANMTSEARDLYAHDRKSFYTLVPTPPRNKQELKKSTALNKTPCVSKLGLSNTPATAAMKTNLKPVNATKSQSTVKTGTIPKTCTKPTALVAPTTKTLGRVLTYPSTASKTTTPAGGVPKSKAGTNNVGVTVPLKKNGSAEKPIANHLKSAHKLTKPQPSKKATAITQTKSVAHERKFCATAAAKTQKTASTGITTGAVGKAHLLQSKRAAAVTATTKPNEQRNAKFATSFKAKKIQVSTFNRPNAPNKITIKGKTLLGGGVRPCKTDAVFAIAETPTDLLNINPYEPFVTSTRLKSISPHKSNAPNISPIGKELDGMAVTKSGQQKHQNIRATHGSTSAKRTLLTNEVKPCIQNPPSQLQRQKSKFNFIRYSAGLSELDTSYENEMKIEEEEKKDLTEFKSAQQITVLEVKPMQVIEEDNLAMPLQSGTNCKLSSDKTPTSNESERPVNYVGSFVSISRGKVSARKEREKRDSIYVPSADVTLLATAPNTPVKAKQEVMCQPTIVTPISIEARRMLEAVRYFRQQLNSEIERLHALCDQWEVYKQQNSNLLQETCGDDMINVTVGQAKLLTSKKFQQFGGLIDRCESGARGTAAACDGSEDTKPVTDVDLEGFWSMLNLQVENVEKRFDNLTRWKSNNWSDPDDAIQTNKQIKPKAKSNLTKVKKAKAPAKTAKASSGLQAMLRKMHAEMRKNKETVITAETHATDAVLTFIPSHQRQRLSHSGTPKGECSTETERNSTPRRVSVVVRDRKSLSAAATVISLPADSTVASAVAAQRRISRLFAANGVNESPRSLHSYSNELRRSISNMEKAFGNCSDLRRTTLSGNAHKARRRSGTPNFVESPLGTGLNQQPQQPESCTPPTIGGRKSILKTPGIAKGKPKSVIFSEKLRVKKFKFTFEDDDKLSDEEELMQTSNEGLLNDQQRTYSLRTRKVVLRPSSEFEIPKA